MPAPDPIKTCSTWINKNMYIRDSKPVVLVPLCILLTEYTLLTNQSTHSTTPGACATATDFILSIPLIKKIHEVSNFSFHPIFLRLLVSVCCFFHPFFFSISFFFHRWKGYFLCTLGKASVFFTSLFFSDLIWSNLLRLQQVPGWMCCCHVDLYHRVFSPPIDWKIDYISPLLPHRFSRDFSFQFDFILLNLIYV